MKRSGPFTEPADSQHSSLLHLILVASQSLLYGKEVVACFLQEAVDRPSGEFCHRQTGA